MDQGTIVVIAVSVLLAAWYGGGWLYNCRRGRSLRTWLEAGLSVLDGESEVGWIGSSASGARIIVRRARPPFRRLEMTLLLANREILLLWLVDSLRGKRDTLIIRGTLRSPRRGEVTVASDGPTDKEAGSWTWQHGPDGLSVGYRGLNGQRMAATLEPWLDAYGSHLHRFHWRKQDPHVNLQLRIAGLLDTKAETLLTDLSNALRA
ncbi:MAG: hypothetical protein PVJ55_11225 [Anaerolineae bacterium]